MSKFRKYKCFNFDGYETILCAISIIMADLLFVAVFHQLYIAISNICVFASKQEEIWNGILIEKVGCTYDAKIFWLAD